ncbi:VanW family protein [Paenibacillus kobensis]|uniref:VanW family protein n=1 Tax=Paenibacillus kobensis TaxID=59841 RepID=UPI001FE975E2|nr:VanW family protein [Paenibacillus kobensis]
MFKGIRSLGLFGMLFIYPLTPSSTPLTVDLHGQPVASIKRIDYMANIPGLPVVNELKVERLMDSLEKKTNIPSVNAVLDAGGRVVPEKIGYRLDRRQFAEQVYSYLIEGGMTRTNLPQNKVYPRVDSELMTLIKEKQIGYYTTYFNSRNRNRTTNIALAAQAINNHVVFPGETFSFNGVVGQRSTEKGYMRAPVIVKGEVSEGIGGGICQISSTLFNAADRAGLQIVQRYSHSRNVPYVPPGRDATVSWYGPDFVFKNRYSQPILIRAYVYGGQVSISIFSSEAVDHEPRQVPSASKKLPEEVRMEQSVGAGKAAND